MKRYVYFLCLLLLCWVTAYAFTPPSGRYHNITSDNGVLSGFDNVEGSGTGRVSGFTFGDPDRTDQGEFGNLTGVIPVYDVSDNTVLASSQTYGSVVFILDNITVTLPPVVRGMSTCIQVIDNNTGTVKPDASDGIRLNGGIRNTDGNYIQSSGTAGDMICVVGDSVDGWTTTGRAGTWTEE